MQPQPDLDREALEAAELALHQEGLTGTRAEIAIRAYLARRRQQGYVEVPMEPTEFKQAWRVGRHYGIHVYAGDEPIATFHTVAAAKHAVRSHNTLIRAASSDTPAPREEP